MADEKEEAGFKDTFETLQSEKPAYLVKNVDKEEHAFILDSFPSSPVQSPRALLQGREDQSSDEQAPKSSNEASNVLSSLPLPGAGIDPELLSPGPAEENKAGSDQGALLAPIHHNMYLRQSEEWVNRLAHDARHEGEWQRTKEGKWSVNHARMLYLVSLLASESSSEVDAHSWVNDQFLDILSFEAVAHGLFTMLVSPCLVRMREDKGKTIDLWLKLPKEVKLILYELCSASYLEVIRFPTEEGWSYSSYRASARGEKFLQETPDELREEVDAFVRQTFNAPESASISDVVSSLANFSLRGDKIYIRQVDGSERESLITEIERISYVTSPYIPVSLSDNSELAQLCPHWQDQVVDYRSESFILSSVAVLFVEWIMSGPNFVNSIISQLDGVYKVFKTLPPQSTMVDWKDTFTTSSFAREMYEMQSTIIDSSLTCVNFEMEDRTSAVGEKQRKQHFGVNVNANGVFIHGVQVEAVKDREWDDVSPYLLSYIMSDIHHDACQMSASFLNSFQKEMLSNLYAGMEMKRAKYVCVTADRLDPPLRAKDFMGNLTYRADCERLIGDLYEARDLGQHDLVVVGSNGILLAGPASKEAEYLILDYAVLKVVDRFVRRLHARMKGINNFLSSCRSKMVSQDVSKLEEALQSRQQFNEVLLSFQSLVTCLDDVSESISRWESHQKSKMSFHQGLSEYLNLRSYHEDLKSRYEDLANVFLRAKNEVETILEVSNIQGRMRYEQVLSSVHKDLKALALPRNCMVSHRGRVLLPSHVSLKVVVVALLASLIYDLVNRVHLGIQIGTSAPSWLADHTNGWNDQPLLLGAALFLVVALADRFLVNYIERYSELTTKFVKKVINTGFKVVSYNNLVKFLHKQECTFAKFRVADSELRLHKVFSASFMDKNLRKWTTDNPRISVLVDATNLWILSAQYDWDYYAKSIANVDVKKDFVEQLEKAGIVESKVKRKGWVLSRFLHYG
ncbi:hypothetical protein GUITHDRAFT_146213 [Guillardia theta CCMP2712]|uniref:Uncharacterized protein n=1 Tax=Guillardia theta (strain CCMP2712) TaxID=905079 RepID=L1IIY2_GUITC|nr:hypothetical protein GUITHDRAFT_146213 [Guillardia theta CCMP2712]EKX35869.1 hypothetical protein GUITHDRAFT_146213 [Guillardia theta CCMP2712]|eukprot:XP_005822849.1 hypothetical protein GUITHDRAFT_146213 [Guillardia theta CCMP2712]